MFNRMSADQIDKLDATIKKLQREHSERAKIEDVSEQFGKKLKFYADI